MRSVVEDLEAASKYLDDAECMAGNAAVLLERVSGSLAEDAQIAARLLDELRGRSRKALGALESV